MLITKHMIIAANNRVLTKETVKSCLFEKTYASTGQTNPTAQKAVERAMSIAEKSAFVSTSILATGIRNIRMTSKTNQIAEIKTSMYFFILLYYFFKGAVYHKTLVGHGVCAGDECDHLAVFVKLYVFVCKKAF